MNDNSNQSGNSSDGMTLLMPTNPIQASIQTALVQVVVWPFLSVLLYMLFVYLKRKMLLAEARYTLFAQSLFSDSCLLVMTDFVVISMYLGQLMPIGFCIPVVILMDVFSNISPCIIIAMCLERYAAICMPLRHVKVFSPSRTLLYIAIIWFVCFSASFGDLFILLAFSTKDYFEELTFCYYEIMFVDDWHMEIRGMYYIYDSLIVLSIVLFCYTSIIIVAHRASGDDKQSASKGQRTILFHMLQLILCTLEVICPYVESHFMSVSLDTYLIMRFFNFLLFTIVTKILSTVIYGLRDEKLRASMKLYITFTRKVHHDPNK